MVRKVVHLDNLFGLQVFNWLYDSLLDLILDEGIILLECECMGLAEGDGVDLETTSNTTGSCLAALVVDPSTVSIFSMVQ